MDITWWEAISLGALQGVSEFLPISSSGHLALLERVYGLASLPITFDILLHVGTLVAMIVYFWSDIRGASLRLWRNILLANVPIVIFGFALRPYVPMMKESRLGLALAFLITALLLCIADEILFQKNRSTAPWTPVLQKIQAWFQGQKHLEPEFLSLFVVGIFQTLAIIPGVSRSGSSLAGGAVSGLDRRRAFRYAFLIGLPAIVGAAVLDLLQNWGQATLANIDMNATLVAMLVAAGVGLFSLRLLEYVILKSRLRHFAVYCLLVSIVSLLIV